MFVKKVSASIYRIGYAPGLLNGALAMAGDRVVLVDLGHRLTWPVLSYSLSQLGLSPREVTDVLITHAHADHVGALARLRRIAPEARFYAHEREVPFLQEGKAPPVTVIPGLLRHRASIPAVSQLEVVRDGELLDLGLSCRVIHAPGHTPGSCCYLFAEQGVMVVGDALTNIVGPGFSPAISCTDRQEALRSLARVLSVDFEVAIFGHGSVMAGRARDRIAAVLGGGAA
jgi:glyoxylase-like metal-dependent hydrolase (beta-lactamase superfamily II)